MERDPRLGFKVKGQPTQWPAQCANGAPFGRAGQPTTRVPLAGGYFYVLPVGVGSTPNHAELAAIAESYSAPPVESPPEADPADLVAQVDEEP
jgi:hypothetical protein